MTIQTPLAKAFDLIETLCQDGHFEETTCAARYAQFRADSILHNSQVTGVSFSPAGNHPVNELFTLIESSSDSTALYAIYDRIVDRLDLDEMYEELAEIA
jgi:hypothetical protein